jgi:hypothetical protein
MYNRDGRRSSKSIPFVIIVIIIYYEPLLSKTSLPQLPFLSAPPRLEPRISPKIWPLGDDVDQNRDSRQHENLFSLLVPSGEASVAPMAIKDPARNAEARA